MGPVQPHFGEGLGHTHVAVVTRQGPDALLMLEVGHELLDVAGNRIGLVGLVTVINHGKLVKQRADVIGMHLAGPCIGGEGPVGMSLILEEHPQIVGDKTEVTQEVPLDGLHAFQAAFGLGDGWHHAIPELLAACGDGERVRFRTRPRAQEGRTVGYGQKVLTHPEIRDGLNGQGVRDIFAG